MKTIQAIQPLFKCNYNDNEFYQEISAPENLPDWAIASSESSESSEKEKEKEKEPKRKITKEAIKSELKRKRLTDYE